MNQNLHVIIDHNLDTKNNIQKIYIHPYFQSIKEQSTILNYHWDDYDKLKKDYNYLNELQLKLIDKIGEFLNIFHKTSHSNKYWEILIGDWIYTYCVIIFDRWEMTTSLQNLNKNITIELKNYFEKDMLAQSVDELNNLLYLNDYNSYLFSKILNHRFLENKNFSIILKDIEPKEFFLNKLKFRQKPSIKNKLLKIYNFVFSKKLRNQKFALIRTYLGKKELIKLNFKLLQIPNFVPNNYYNCEPDIELRKKIKLNLYANNSFEKFLIENIFLFLPISYLEGFQIEKKKLYQLNLPSNPKKIFSCNILSKSLLKRYCADKIENGSKLILGTHGGSYGHYDLHSSEKHEIKISDQYLTWGWKNKAITKVTPFGIIRPQIKFLTKKKTNRLTVIIPAIAIFEKNIESHISLIKNKKLIFKPVFKILDNLDSDLKKKNLLLRFYNRNFGCNEFDIFNKKYPLINKDKMEIKFEKLLSETKIFLSPYIGTGYLETLSLNITTIVFNSKDNSYLIRDDAKKHYNKLKRAKIFFDDEKQLANHINYVWKDVDSWWKSQDVQKIVKDFCKEYAHNNDNKIEDLKNLLIN
jgi:putative transferase (TIGR04331 family)